MKELIFISALIILGFALMADTTITWKPFSVKFESPYNAVGYLLIFVGIIFIKVDSERKGAKKAIDQIIEQVYNTKSEN